MKVNQSVHVDGENLIFKTTHSADSALHRARVMRDAGKQNMGESKAVAVVPAALLFKWAKDAGVDITDSQAMREVVDKQLACSDNRQFRVWDGTY